MHSWWNVYCKPLIFRSHYILSPLFLCCCLILLIHGNSHYKVLWLKGHKGRRGHQMCTATPAYNPRITEPQHDLQPHYRATLTVFNLCLGLQYHTIHPFQQGARLLWEQHFLFGRLKISPLLMAWSEQCFRFFFPRLPNYASNMEQIWGEIWSKFIANFAHRENKMYDFKKKKTFFTRREK